MKFLTDEGRAFLQNSTNFEIAHLVTLELPGNTGAQVRYTDFKRDLVHNGNTYLSGHVKQIGEVRYTNQLTNFTLPITVSGLAEGELDRILQSTSYIGKSISVERIFLDKQHNIIPVTEGGGVIYFSGELTSMGIKDTTSLTAVGSSVITWSASSKLNNFNKVNGRITDDSSHRGLVTINNVAVPSGSAKKLEYQTDKGFFHANKSVNVLAQYQAREKRYRLVSKRASGLKGWLGARKYSTQEYWATVSRQVKLDIDLNAKYIPVIYGCQRAPGIPVFVDTPADDPTTVWAVYAVCEGEIEGFLDLYLDDKPMICAGRQDTKIRRLCVGNKRSRGDTISIAEVSATTPDDGIIDTTVPSTHGQEYVYNDGNGEIRFWTYHGKSDQEASQVLVDIAAANGFKIQQDQDAGTDYWDETFKLVDTAYIVMKVDLTSERTTIPSVECEVQGKKIRVYTDADTFSEDKTSLNFAWQTLDYLTNGVYGAAVPLTQVPLAPFLEGAALMDAIDESYQAAWCPYWRYIGWDNNSDDNRQVMQGSALLNTSTEVFKNMDSLLTQYDACLNPINGLYQLSLEALKEPVVSINIDQVLPGTFQLLDTTNRNKFNSIQASISDPSAGWNTKAVNFFNSDFLAEDNYVENKGQVPFPYIINYYTARSRAARLLRKSRLTKEVTMSLPLEFMELSPYDIMAFTHPRYGWSEKQFIVTQVKHTARGQINLTAVEFDPSTLINSEQDDVSEDQDTEVPVEVLPPNNLVYEPETGVDTVGLQGHLVWEPSASSVISYYSIKRTGRLQIDTLQATEIDTTTGKLRFPISNVPAGTYTFEVRAVNALGQVSSPATLIADLSPSLSLDPVTNFRVTNLTTQNGTVFSGSSLDLAWDPVTEIVADQHYEVELRDSSNTSLRVVSIAYSDNAYSYTLDLNKADYASQNEDAVGFYRALNPRVRAVGANGAQSATWTEL